MIVGLTHVVLLLHRFLGDSVIASVNRRLTFFKQSHPPSPSRGIQNDNEILKGATKEEELVSALGITMMAVRSPPRTSKDAGEHVVVHDPHADEVDLSDLRGIKAPTKGPQEMSMYISSEIAPIMFCREYGLTFSIFVVTMKSEIENDDLEALAELVPGLKSKSSKERENHTMTVDLNDQVATEIVVSKEADEEPIEVAPADLERKMTVDEKATLEEDAQLQNAAAPLAHFDSMDMRGISEIEDRKPPPVAAMAPAIELSDAPAPIVLTGDEEQNLGGFDTVDSDDALNSDDGMGSNTYGKEASKPEDPYPNISSGVSLSTATQTHEVRQPMYLPTFKPATGCTNASDFIVRCFVARLRSGITVVKHGRARWCKSRLRILHIHPDGRSLSWKPAVGEPTSSKRPPKLDLSTCEEVRHAWSPDPLNPMFTGTSILRHKCETANGHKSFALIFPKRTVDITAVTADQCKVLMEGFSALCFRLQVANLAGRGAKKGKERY